jgi:hypothetical protein
MRVRVSTSQIAASIAIATAIMNSRYCGNVMPNACIQPTGPSSSSGTRYGTAARPQMTCTSSTMMYESPKVKSSSGTWPH